MLYETLWLSPSCTAEDIKVHYKMLAKAVHPDRHDEQIERANLAFREVDDAYAVLSNPITRAIYDDYGKDGLAMYESYKQFFEDVPKEGADVRPKTLARYRAVKIMHDNTKAIEQIDRQSIKVSSSMVYYFMLNARRWMYPKPFLRFTNMTYQASMKYDKGKFLSLAVDGTDGRPLPSVNHHWTMATRVLGVSLDLTLINELTNLSNFTLEVSKMGFEKL